MVNRKGELKLDAKDTAINVNLDQSPGNSGNQYSPEEAS